MEIQFAKEFICQDIMSEIIYITKSFEKVEELLSQFKWLSVWGVFDTKYGLELFEIDQRYDGEYFIWRRFMHRDSFLEFNNYELGVKLNEVGFNYDTKEVYEVDVLLERYFEIPKPTISQVLKWLREEKEIFIRVTLSYDYSTDADGEQVDRWTFWLFEVFSVGSGSLIYTEEISEYDSFELAALAGIEYVIDNLI